MAYSNWGAFVYKDGKRRRNREDVAPFDDHLKAYPSGARIWANLLEWQNKGGNLEEMPFHKHCHHAVLGDGLVRLCGYKNEAILWKAEGGKISQVKLPEPSYKKGEWEIKREGKLKVGDETWKWGFLQYHGNMIHLWLREPDGSQWKSTCGYQYGAGFMD